MFSADVLLYGPFKIFSKCESKSQCWNFKVFSLESLKSSYAPVQFKQREIGYFECESFIFLWIDQE